MTARAFHMLRCRSALDGKQTSVTLSRMKILRTSLLAAAVLLFAAAARADTTKDEGFGDLSVDQVADLIAKTTATDVRDDPASLTASVNRICDPPGAISPAQQERPRTVQLRPERGRDERDAERRQDGRECSCAGLAPAQPEPHGHRHAAEQRRRGEGEQQPAVTWAAAGGRRVRERLQPQALRARSRPGSRRSRGTPRRRGGRRRA